MTTPFVNWAGNIQRTPRRWCRPRGVEEVAEEVARAADEGLRVRACGSGHSWSDVAADDGVVQVDLSAMNQVVAVQGDRVTAQAGVTLQQVVDALASHGRALPILGSVTAQTLAGAIGTGTHGSSLREGCLSDQVLAAELVDGQGQIHRFDPGDPALDGVRLHLGRLGVLTQLTLRTVPAFALRERRTRIPLKGAAEATLAATRDHPFAKLWWLPGRPHAVLFTYERVGDPLPPGSHPLSLAQRVADRVANGWLFPGLLALGARAPALIRPINHLVDAVHLPPGTRAGPMQHLLPLAMPPRHRETEWAVPLTQAEEAWRAVVHTLTRHPLDFIAELRPVPRSPAWLAPTHDGERLHLGVYAARAPWRDTTFREVDDAMLALDGRPHWGKEGAPRAPEVRWPGAPRFRELVRRLDPQGRLAHPGIDAALRLTA